MMKHAAIARKKHEVMENPTGINCVDIEVHTVTTNRKRRILKASRGAMFEPGFTWRTPSGGKLDVDPASMFPIVEGIFGPLRIPLPRTPVMLVSEYGGVGHHTFQQSHYR